MYKKIVAAIADINSQEDFDTVCGMIDTAFQQEKISWKDHEVLYAVVSKIAIEK